MVRHITVVVGLTGAISLAGVATGLEPADPGSSVRCKVRAVTLEEPAYMVVDAVVRGDRLLLPDFTNGLREIDLESGSNLRSLLPMGRKRGQVTGPQHLGCGGTICGNNLGAGGFEICEGRGEPGSGVERSQDPGHCGTAHGGVGDLFGVVRFSDEPPADYWAERSYDWYAGL